MGLNHIWSRLIIEELIRCGVTTLCISPGSRSAPLVIAAAENKRACTLVHTDERGAAFYAMGYAKATGRPAALICTSGTAVANYFPAVIEASQSAIPLLILSSDRPVELRDARSPQTINQVNIFGDYLRWHFDLPAPDKALSPSFLLTTVDQAVYRAINRPAGPVQINCQFREPLISSAEKECWDNYLSILDHWQKTGRAFTTHAKSESIPSIEDVHRIGKMIRSSENGLLIVGQLPSGTDKEAIIRLASELGWPLLADINSGIRFAGSASESASNVIAHYDLYLRVKKFRKKFSPDLILHMGDMPVSKSLNQYIEESHAEYIVVNSHPFRQDPMFRVTQRIETNPGRFALQLSERIQKTASGLTGIFCQAEEISRTVIRDSVLPLDDIREWAVSHVIFESVAEESGIYLGNSLPVREADAFAACSDKRLAIGCNRGANGIDGTIASAIGFASGLNRPSTLLIGDLAILHDINSLALIKKLEVPVTVVVLNNDGGGIFSFLPVAKLTEYFETYFATPHGLKFRNAAELFGLPYESPESLSSFRKVYQRSIDSGISSIIEVHTQRDKNRVEHEMIWKKVAEKIQTQLLSG
ncbi:MAG: 2-succinyl-5-enolpyruvyl-6-hydroxy-3-cyclohexene-1-carboxylic-acid synthase [Deltaproteobacteria bacterium]|nr:2-succinyl-5-enolpyruvyl-6-hydroxy-3-cyclohexene-1-carboxylic-acid synthase [Deltaproteobacteria bacterium]MBW1795476.1 2-succinyl-5-enolpyruvyl-6-hydroxy-3-cyclohexene-1-carboxylic-acid synthase [Deltaproteobacteria bacterium]